MFKTEHAQIWVSLSRANYFLRWQQERQMGEFNPLQSIWVHQAPCFAIVIGETIACGQQTVHTLQFFWGFLFDAGCNNSNELVTNGLSLNKNYLQRLALEAWTKPEKKQNK